MDIILEKLLTNLIIIAQMTNVSLAIATTKGAARDSWIKKVLDEDMMPLNAIEVLLKSLEDGSMTVQAFQHCNAMLEILIVKDPEIRKLASELSPCFIKNVSANYDRQMNLPMINS